MLEISLISAFLLGLLGSGHCLGMCGGIISSLSIATEDGKQQWWKVGIYQLGRISSYALFGLLAGLLGQQADKVIEFPFLQLLSASLLILMGLYISRLWMALSYLEKAGKILWQKISPLSKQLLPVKTLKQALFLGFLWGWLPCGLVYTGLGYALTQADPLNSALYMLLFGIGTLPATIFAGVASLSVKRGLNHPVFRNLIGLAFFAFGVYTLLQLDFSSENGQHHHHHHGYHSFSLLFNPLDSLNLVGSNLVDHYLVSPYLIG